MTMWQQQWLNNCSPEIILDGSTMAAGNHLSVTSFLPLACNEIAIFQFGVSIKIWSCWKYWPAIMITIFQFGLHQYDHFNDFGVYDNFVWPAMHYWWDYDMVTFCWSIYDKKKTLTPIRIEVHVSHLEGGTKGGLRGQYSILNNKNMVFLAC